MERFEKTKRVGILGILGNIFLLIIKSIIGFSCKSQAMIADAANSASDIFASVMTFIGNRIASVPMDEEHNFGHGKAEYIFSLFISLSMIGLAAKILIDSINCLRFGSSLNFSWWLVIVSLTTIIVKACLFLYANKLSKEFDNILLDANKNDHRNDCIVTTFTLIATLLTLVNIYWFDGVVGLCISIWIAYTGFQIFIESYNVLMDISIDSSSKEKIIELTKKYPEIKEISHFYSSPVGYQHFVVLTIHVDGNMSTYRSHEIADILEKDITQLNSVYHTFIHVNPI